MSDPSDAPAERWWAMLAQAESFLAAQQTREAVARARALLRELSTFVPASERDARDRDELLARARHDLSRYEAARRAQDERVRERQRQMQARELEVLRSGEHWPHEAARPPPARPRLPRWLRP